MGGVMGWSHPFRIWKNLIIMPSKHEVIGLPSWKWRQLSQEFSKHTYTQTARSAPRKVEHSPLLHHSRASGQRGLWERVWTHHSPPHEGRGQTPGKPGNSERHHPDSASIQNGFGTRSYWVPCQARLEPGATTVWNQTANRSMLGEVVRWIHEV